MQLILQMMNVEIGGDLGRTAPVEVANGAMDAGEVFANLMLTEQAAGVLEDASIPALDPGNQRPARPDFLPISDLEIGDGRALLPEKAHSKLAGLDGQQAEPAVLAASSGIRHAQADDSPVDGPSSNSNSRTTPMDVVGKSGPDPDFHVEPLGGHLKGSKESVLDADGQADKGLARASNEKATIFAPVERSGFGVAVAAATQDVAAKSAVEYKAEKKVHLAGEHGEWPVVPTRSQTERRDMNEVFQAKSRQVSLDQDVNVATPQVVKTEASETIPKAPQQMKLGGNSNLRADSIDMPVDKAHSVVPPSAHPKSDPVVLANPAPPIEAAMIEKVNPVTDRPRAEREFDSRERAHPGTGSGPEATRIPMSASSLAIVQGPVVAMNVIVGRPELHNHHDSLERGVEVLDLVSPTESADTKRSSGTSPLRSVENIVRPVIAQIVRASKAAVDGVVEVRLSPEELGRVRLSLSASDSGMVVHVVAERPETLDLLRRNIDLFAADLKEQGFADLDFSFGQDQGADHAKRQVATGEADADGAALALVAQTGLAQEMLPDGKLDIRL